MAKKRDLIKEIKRLRLKKNDVLLVETAVQVTDKERETMNNVFRSIYKHNPIVFHNGHIRFTVVEQEEVDKMEIKEEE